MTNAQRVLINTTALYARVAVTMVLGLLTSRLILSTLGVVDFGLYSVVAGIMGFMAFLNGAMSTSSQRHITHCLGRGDLIQVNRIFKTAFFLHASLAVLLVTLGETIGLWFLTYVLNIPESRSEAVFWIYQFNVFSTALYVVSVPYQALLTAHEALVSVSIIGITQTVLSFFLALLIVYAPGDKLVFYVMGSSVIAIFMRLTQMMLCRNRYAESRLNTANQINKDLTVELMSFSGWNLFGSLSVVGRFQGVAFLLNIFFGPSVNAAYGIASQVSGAMSNLTQSMLQAVSPRLVKEEGAGNRKRMFELSLLTSKYGFFIACLFGIPLFATMDSILELWLNSPPQHSTTFCRIILLMFICDQLSSGFGLVVSAIGQVARYQIIIGSIQLSTIPMGYVFLKMGYNQNAVLVCALFAMIVASASRGIVVQFITDFSYSIWLKNVVFRGLMAVSPAFLFNYIFIEYVRPSVGGILVLSVTSGFITIAGCIFVGMSKEERKRFTEIVFSIKKNVFLTNSIH